MKKPLRICDVEILPGETASLALPYPELYTCASMHMPIRVINGVKEGPCILIFSMLNGYEMNGFEIINRVLEIGDLHKNLAGTLIAIPVMNVYSMLNYPNKHSPGFKIESSFPGKPNGTYGERIANIFTQEILTKVDFCIELQTGALNHNILPQIYCNFNDIPTKELARQFGAPVVIDVKIDRSKLRETTDSLNIPLIVYEAGEAMRFCQPSIELGYNGILNVLSALGVLSRESSEIENPFFAQDNRWIRSPKSGVVHTKLTLGQHVKKNDKIASITDPFSNDLSEPIYSQIEGIVVGINEAPLVYEGQSIFKLASFIDNKKAEESLEQWDESDSSSN